MYWYVFLHLSSGRGQACSWKGFWGGFYRCCEARKMLQTAYMEVVFLRVFPPDSDLVLRRVTSR